jgi:hypothetical protein
MKTLDQIEARSSIGTPGQVTTSTLTISQPGSYVLMGPVTVSEGNGITISSGNVTLDLNGFTITSTAASGPGSGVYLAGIGNFSNISISNGFISGAFTVDSTTGVGSGSGFEYGILMGTVAQRNLKVSHVSVRGIRIHGILLSHASSSFISNCQASHIGNSGLTANMVVDSMVSDCLGFAINATMARSCVVAAPFATRGIYAKSVMDSVSTARDYGIYGTIVSNSIGNGQTGIVGFDCISNSSGTGRSENADPLSTITGISSSGVVSFSMGQSGMPDGVSGRAIIGKLVIGSPLPYDSIDTILSAQKHLGTP